MFKDRSPLANSDKQLKAAFTNFSPVAFICQITVYLSFLLKKTYLASSAGGSRGCRNPLAAICSNP